MLFSATNSHAQDVDTWLLAGRAVNNPALPDPLPNPPGTQLWLLTPLPPADGTPVDIWYDFVDFSNQDAIPHPADPLDYDDPYPIGFANLTQNGNPYGTPSFLDPTGSVPGAPTLRRNNTDNINFNPVVQFDGSGDGQALHFRSVSREDITVFIVFKAEGAGNTAASQRLLLGGDMEVHHSSTTNLSLGIADGNRFSVGRTWKNDDTDGDPDMDGDGRFYQGGIDLLGVPTIGTFTRTSIEDSDEETFITHVNGIEDLNITRGHADADKKLYIFNRLGKHFNSNNSNYNLTGDIAEVLLADGAYTSTYRQRAESYLAVKYGITLNTGGNVLGSIDGNDSYNYLAADGTTIWQSENTYKYNIAGIGVDRFDDDNTVGLRYNIDQRISKSVNSSAVVTMSTNNDFSTDNLDLSRTTIDGDGSSHDHNYLLWASNDNTNSSLDQTNSELPSGIDYRIIREWKIQKSTTGGRAPISNVSMRVDLSGSNILDNGNCNIKLLIDTDNGDPSEPDGDFTTGTITMIDATSIDMAGNVYFDGIDFLHNEFFTIGYVDSTPDIDPVSNVTACDSYDLSSINVTGTDLVGPTFYDAAGGPAGGGSTIAANQVLNATTTVYIWDETANGCSDQQSFTVTIEDTPDIDPVSNVTACDSYDLSSINVTGTDLVGPTFYDAAGGPAGGGSTIAANQVLNATTTVYIWDETANGCSDQQSFTVTIEDTPDIDPVSNVTACDSYDLSSINVTGTDLVGPTFYDAAGGPAGGGSTIAANQVLNATTTVYIWDETANGCSDQQSFTVTIEDTPDIDPVSNVTACDSYDLSSINVTGTDLVGPTFYDAAGGPAGGGSTIAANQVLNATTTVYIWDETANGCSDQQSFTVTIEDNEPPTADNLPQINLFCEELPAPDPNIVTGVTDNCGIPTVTHVSDVSDGGFNPETITRTYAVTDGGGNSIQIQQLIALSQTVFYADIDEENGRVTISESNGLAPYRVRLNGLPEMVFNHDTFIIDGLTSGNHVLNIVDAQGCEETFEILINDPNLNATIEPIYNCDGSNSILVKLQDSSVASNVLYALDSTNPSDFVINPDFSNINPGEHFLYILHSNGSLQGIPFKIDGNTPLQLSLVNTNINEITATVTGGTETYTYFLDNHSGINDNVLYITENGKHTVRVIDANGCEASASIALEFLDIEIPNFFTPNNDGQNDTWSPKNIEGFPNIETIIFDRYGREIRIMGALGNGWDGLYEGSALPSGDYWYIVKLNDESEREFVGHFTLYR
ncbi:T9SS type B sorting domain-containing protein [Flagellimonas sp.]|uniref:T9SS type B sorting domain-containing protein n=1 Tax=Flagellimonas sp. TaxID=2058762 RepID=UPI003B5BAA11